MGSLFGDRAYYNGDWLKRAAAAKVGIFGNSAIEAMYPLTRVLPKGEKLDGSKHNYTLTLAKGDLPPRLYWPKETPPSILPAGEGTWTPLAVVQA